MHNPFRMQMKQPHAYMNEVFPDDIVHKRFLVLLLICEQVAFLAVFHHNVDFGAADVTVFVANDEVTIYTVEYFNFFEQTLLLSLV